MNSFGKLLLKQNCIQRDNILQTFIKRNKVMVYMYQHMPKMTTKTLLTFFCYVEEIQ